MTVDGAAAHAGPDGMDSIPEHSGGESEDWDGLGSAGSADGFGQRRLGEAQEVLDAIFEYYSSQGKSSALTEPRITSTRFQRMAMDSALIDNRLTSAKVDVLFHRTCSGSPHMSLEQFRDAIVRIAVEKFPRLSKQEAVLELFEGHLSNFSAESVSSTVAELGADSVAAIAAAGQPLRTLFDSYFGPPLRRLSMERRPSGGAGPPQQGRASGDLQAAFVQLLVDFEVMPDLAPKSTVHALFREVGRLKEVPGTLRARLAPQGPEAAGAPHRFGFPHFAIAMVLVAHRCFGDPGPSSVTRLLEWMDASKGRLVFAASFPGRLPGGSAGLRLAPPPARPAEAPAPGACAPRRRSSAAAPPQPAAAGLARSASSSSTAGAGRGGPPGGPLGGGPAAPGPPSAPASDPTAAAAARAGGAPPGPAALPEWAVRLVRQTFGHYAALADPLNRTSLSSLKFRRFLRDCGLLSSEARTASGSGSGSGPGSFGFVPGARRRSASSSAGPLGGGEPRRCTEASLGGSAPGGLLRSGSLGPARRGSASLSVSRGGLASGLPLRVFGKALLTEVQADLLFVQALRAEGAGPAAARRSGSMGPARGGGGGAVARAPGKQLGVEGFRKLLQDLSQRCAPHLRPAGADPASSSLELFCGQVLGPLNQLLLEASGSEAAAAARTMESPEAVLLLRRARPGVERLFAAYASAAPGREPAWSVEATARFAEDFHVSQELGPLTVQRAFQDCIHHEGCRSGGSDAELSAATLELVLVLLAQKLHGSQQGATPLEKVLELFRLMNGIASSSGFAGRSWPPHEQLIPVPLARRASADSLTAAPRASRDAGDMTWADMLVGDEAP